MARKCKGEFSQSERDALKEAFDAGIDGVSKGKLHLVQELSQKLDRNERRLK